MMGEIPFNCEDCKVDIKYEMYFVDGYFYCKKCFDDRRKDMKD